MLLEANILRLKCFMTNVAARKPPHNELYRLCHPFSRMLPAYRGLHLTEDLQNELARLHNQLERVRPKLVIACGNWALWALTDCASISSVSLGNGQTVRVPAGITSWRGSMLFSPSGLRVLPIIHPAAILRAWYQRAVTVHDLRARVPLALADDWLPSPPPKIIIPKTLDEAIAPLRRWIELANGGPLRLANDIETLNRRLITCIGFADGPFNSTGTALVIPLICLEQNGHFESWFPPAEEAKIFKLLRTILTHPNILLEGQNYLYDTQYFQQFYGVTPRCDFDTMLAHHLLFPGTPKGLDYLSSLHCHYHRFWKEDGKDWVEKQDQLSQLRYNGEDCLRTYEVATALRQLISNMGMSDLWRNEQRKSSLALRMMNRGILVDSSRKAAAGFELLSALQTVHRRLESIIPDASAKKLITIKSKKKWFESERQTAQLLYDGLGLTKQNHRKTGSVTVNDEALNVLAEKHPELSTLFELLKAERSINTINSNVVRAEADPDGRMRCSFKPDGTETFRWSSAANAFGRGMNMQNITSGDEE